MTDGVILIHKPMGITSFDVVAKLRKLYGTKKVGHTGTLDPMATGLLPVLIGRAVKASEFLIEKDKEYIAGLRLGMTTDTEDVTGKILTTSDDIPDRQTVLDTAASFVGNIMQIPPLYSALKVDGQKLCDLARRGITVERQPRPITVYGIDIDGDNRDYTMRVTCSKGTYIRTLCADIGAKLGCGACMSSLVRKTAGPFSLDNAYTLDELESMTVEERLGKLIPTEQLFTSYEKTVLPDFYAKLSKNGCEIYQSKIGTAFPEKERIRVYDKRGFYGIGEVRAYENGSAIKIIKRFDIESQ